MSEAGLNRSVLGGIKGKEKETDRARGERESIDNYLSTRQ